MKTSLGKHHIARYTVLGAIILLLSCKTENNQIRTSAEPVAYSLNGKPLFPPQESEASRHVKDSLLHIAEINYKLDSNGLDNIIWYGRRLAYLSQYPKALAIYTRGLKRFPNSPELLRHRGHRNITVRKFNEAIEDLTKAADFIRNRPVQVEPDGIPNRINMPLSSLQFNIWYHLGLACYLKGEYEKAAVAYDSCMRYSTNPDLLCATTDWYYMTLMRAGKTKKASDLLEVITPGLEVIENDGYLQRLLMYKGLVSPDALIRFDQITEENELTVVTQGYGVAFFLETQGDAEKADVIRDRILNTSYWSAFGYIAAEADKYGKRRK